MWLRVFASCLDDVSSNLSEASESSSSSSIITVADVTAADSTAMSRGEAISVDNFEQQAPRHVILDGNRAQHCERRATPTGADFVNEHCNITKEQPNHMAVKLLCLMLRWARTIPSFSQLPVKDQSLLLKNSWHELFVLGAAQWPLPIDNGTQQNDVNCWESHDFLVVDFAVD